MHDYLIYILDKDGKEWTYQVSATNTTEAFADAQDSHLMHGRTIGYSMEARRLDDED